MRYIVLSHIRYIASPVVKNSLTDVGTWRSAIPHGGPLGDPVLLRGRRYPGGGCDRCTRQLDPDLGEP